MVEITVDMYEAAHAALRDRTDERTDMQRIIAAVAPLIEAQARAAAIEEAAKVVEAFKVNLDDDRSAQKQLAEHIRALNDKAAATPEDGG